MNPVDDAGLVQYLQPNLMCDVLASYSAYESGLEHEDNLGIIAEMIELLSRQASCLRQM